MNDQFCAVRPPLRRVLGAVLLTAALVGGASAGTEPTAPAVLFRSGQHDMLYAISQEGQDGIAVGDFGLIVQTRDGGKTWSRQTGVPTDLGLLAVARKGSRCIAAGQRGLILTAADCKSWVESAAVTDARILAVGLNANGVAFAVGGFGTLLKSTDWGRTWEALKVDWGALTGDAAEPHLYDLHVTEAGEVTIVGEFEMVIRSSDGGQRWSLLRRGARSLFAIKVLEDGGIYAVGQEGLILKSDDHGQRWAELPSGTKGLLTGIWADSSGNALASGVYSILRSHDGGRSWQPDDSKVSRLGWHQAIAASGDERARPDFLVVGSGGAVLSVKR